MLTEVKNPRQHKNEPFRRCFLGDNVDLFVWYLKNGEIIGFQLCYDKEQREKALSWNKDEGYDHENVDDGEKGTIDMKRTPILVCDGIPLIDNIVSMFENENAEIDRKVKSFVLSKLYKCPAR